MELIRLRYSATDQPSTVETYIKAVFFFLIFQIYAGSQGNQSSRIYERF